MASEYYGRKGNLVKKYQQMLNSLGAGVKVNGTWGSATEAAYNEHMEKFQRALGLFPGKNPYEAMEFIPRNDEEMKQQAENAYGNLYSGRMEDAQRIALEEREAAQKQLDGLEPAYRQAAEALGENYQRQRQQLSDQALSRGLGRSSYVTDQISGSQKREMSDGQALLGEKAERERELSEAMEKSQSNLSGSMAQLKAERESAILKAIDEYREKDRQRADEALMYNNSLKEKYRKEKEQREQFEKQLANALKIAKMRR